MIALYGELSTGHRESGTLKKRNKDCLKKSLAHVMLTINSGQTWQRTIVPRATPSSKRLTSEEDRRDVQEDKRNKRKAPAAMTVTPDDNAYGPAFPS